MRTFELARAALMVVLIVGLGACGGGQEPGAAHQDNGGSTQALEYVGAEQCGRCHADQLRRWAGSHHDLAMRIASAETVLGDFSDAEFAHHDTVSTFLRRGDAFFVQTDGADGRLAEFQIRYTFGVHPLQQYLAELPNGRLQALSIAWDSRTADAGGQRWFHVYGDEVIDHTDVLHWTAPSQNWDTMCADCHSTGLVKRYDLDADRFDTTWAEINVSCEACHGPGSRHVDWAASPGEGAGSGLVAPLDERRGVSWGLDEQTGNSRRSEPRLTDVEIDTCAPCHSRRARIGDSPLPGDEILNGFLPSLPRVPLYHVDGQILDEVYVYGSFLQSRMHEQGVTCSDCHEPHSLELRAPGPAVCMQCHAAEKFATTSHQLHDPGSPGADCIECHMPPTTYMQVDPRHDHSFRIPRPALSVQFGVPNACNVCHTDKDAEWALQVLRSKGRIDASDVGHWTARLAAAGHSPNLSRELLLGLATDVEVPDIVRASAIARLELTDDAVSGDIARDGSNSASPLIRWSVAQALNAAHPAVRARYGPALLDDPVSAVRLTTATALAPLGREMLPTSVQGPLEKALDEYVDAQMVSAERAEAHVNIGNLQRYLRRLDRSEQAYLTAIRLNPYFVPAYVNLADLLRARGSETEAEAMLRTALDLVPGQSAVHHALGLTLVRQGRLAEAVTELSLAAESDDATARYALAYALAISSEGRNAESAAYLEEALKRFPGDSLLLATLVGIYKGMGDEAAAAATAERMN